MRRRLKWIGIAVGTLALLGSALVVSVYLYDGSGKSRIAKGIVVAGIPVGGLRVPEARSLLERRLVPRLEQPLALTYRGQSFVVEPKRAGLTVSARSAVSRSRPSLTARIAW